MMNINGVKINVPNGANVTVNDNGVFINGKKYESKELDNKEVVKLVINGDVCDVDCSCDVECNDVYGNVKAGRDVSCKNVGKTVTASRDIDVVNVSGDCKAGRDISR